MPGLSFLSKKSWHTSNISNQEKVWIAEQKAAAEEAKLKELTQQIKLEREQEELQKITGQKSSSTGDRGVDWMYEGHKRGEEDEERRKVQEDAQNEAYLLGKEYVPEGQAKHAGDFAVAASMTGALEKASTVGAAIGVGGMTGEEGDGTVLRIQEDGVNNDGTTASATNSTMNDWNQNFHLRHEDPMFSVMQRKQAKDKDVEKKIKLMERAGMVVKGTAESVVAEKKMQQHDEQEDKRRERRRRKDSKRSKKKRKHKHKSHRRHRKRSRRERSSSPSDGGYSSYSSSASYFSEDSRRDRRRRKDDELKSSNRRHDDNDYYDRRHSSDRRRDRHDDDRDHRRKRSESRERRRSERSSERYDDYDDRYERQSKRSSSGRRGKRSRSNSMGREDPRGERRSRGDNYRGSKGDDDRSSMREKDHREYDDRKQPAEESIVAAAAAASKSDSHPKKELYGLIGTSLSNKSNNNKPSKSSNCSSGDYLGPDQKLREAKRQEVERERQSRFGQGRKRQHRDTSEERQLALEEMKRNAHDREKKWSK